MMQKDIRERLTALEQQKAQLWTEEKKMIDKIREEYSAQSKTIYDEMAIQRKTLDSIVTPIISKPEELEFEGWQKITVKQLSGLTHEQLEFLVWKKTGKVDMTKFGTHRTEHRQSYERSLDERKEAAISYLYHDVCSYCHIVTHTKETCSSLLQKTCTACKESGHTIKYCRKQVREVYGKK
jgi:hypothetical protein